MSDWPLLDSLPVVNGVRIAEPPSAFEALYAEARRKEQRMLDDGQVMELPAGKGLWNAAEWRIRSKGMQRLLGALKDQGAGLRILEVGCGNGWLSGRMAEAGHRVLGIDAFTEELEQAARLFTRAAFARANLKTATLDPHGFDAIVFAASIQYFSDPHATVRRALELLAPGGALHILDSVLYPSEAAASFAEQRTRVYYDRLGMAALAKHYHAHALGEFLQYRCTVLSAPRSRLMRLLSGDASPFTHVMIRHEH